MYEHRKIGLNTWRYEMNNSSFYQCISIWMKIVNIYTLPHNIYSTWKRNCVDSVFTRMFQFYLLPFRMNQLHNFSFSSFTMFQSLPLKIHKWIKKSRNEKENKCLQSIFVVNNLKILCRNCTVQCTENEVD